MNVSPGEPDRRAPRDVGRPGARVRRAATRRSAVLVGLVAGVCSVLLGVLGGLALAALGDGDSASVALAERPNVVVIMTDDQTASSVSVMGALRREVAARGTTFLNSYATFPLCCPSRATFFTGQYAHNHRVLSNTPPEGGYQRFRDPEGTLPEALQGAGYQTAHVGKYLNGYGRKGNDISEIPPGWDRWWGFPAYEMYDYPVNDNGEIRRYGVRPSAYQTDVIARLAGRFIEQAAGEEPFFLSVATLAPHTESSQGAESPSARGSGPVAPIVKGAGDPDGQGAPSAPAPPADPPPQGSAPGATDAPRSAAQQTPVTPETTTANPRPAPRDRGAFAGARLDQPPSFNERDIADKPGFVRRVAALSAEEIATLAERHRDRLASLLAVDDLVARVVDELRRIGELDETLIVFTSDNGYLLGEHRLRKKGELYEESTRVPLILRGPGVPAGAEAAQIVGNIDLAPTILEVAGAEPGRVPDGRPLLELAHDPTVATDRAILLENGRSVGVRTSSYFYAQHPSGAVELYDLRSDPFELRSVDAEPEYDDVQAELETRLDELHDCSGASCQ